MAVWQFVIDFVPKQFLLDTYGHLPETISLEDRKKENYFHATLYVIEDLLPYLESFGTFDKNSWSGTRLYKGEGAHDAVTYYNEETGQVEMVSCRVDMRQPQEGFLYSILALAAVFDWYLMARGSRQIFAPTVADLHAAMAHSNAWRFVADPLKFLTDLPKENSGESWAD